MWSREYLEANIHNLVVKPHQRTGYQLITKVRPNIGDTFTSTARSLWYKPEYAAANGTNVINALMDEKRMFDFPKAVPLIADLIRFANVGPDDVVLDSFAGSGTTAHAVLSLNKEDGGKRKFILVECEDYADTITAERVRRVIDGAPHAKKDNLREGLGGSFTFCTLGEPTEVEAMLLGGRLPSYESFAAHLLYTTTGVSAGPGALMPKNEDGLFYSDEKFDHYLLYKPDLEFLQSNASVLNWEQAERMSAASAQNGRTAIVYASTRYVELDDLMDLEVTFCQLPHIVRET